MGLNSKLLCAAAIICIMINCAYYINHRESHNQPPSLSPAQSQVQCPDDIQPTPHLSRAEHNLQCVCTLQGCSILFRSINTTSNPFESRLQYYKSQIFATQHKRDERSGKCTLIMLTYKRLKGLPKILTTYCNVPELDKILIIWNDIASKIPQSILDISKDCTVELVFIIPKENKMSNRFQPRKDIETECVTVIDDDLIFDVEDMKFGIRSWQKFKHLLLGFTDRTRGYTLLKDGTHRYSLGGAPENLISSQNEVGYSIMIPPLFFHRAYLEMLFDPVMIPSELVTYIDNIMNCDDILMSVVVTKFMQDCGWPLSGGLQLQHAKDIHGIQGIGGGLASRKKHPETRTECLGKFTKTFGYLPLVPEFVTLIRGG